MVRMMEMMMASHLVTSFHYLVIFPRKGNQTSWRLTATGRTVQKSMRHRMNLLRFVSYPAKHFNPIVLRSAKTP